jgi:hypothetical protein
LDWYKSSSQLRKVGIHLRCWRKIRLHKCYKLYLKHTRYNSGLELSMVHRCSMKCNGRVRTQCIKSTMSILCIR